MRALSTLAVILAVAVTAQADSPGPPRLAVAGAFPVGARPPARAARLQAPQDRSSARPRRPLLRPAFKSVEPQPEEPAKPVTEEPEDELQSVNTPSGFTPSAFFTTQAPSDLFDFLPTAPPPPARPLFDPIAFQQLAPSTFRPEPPRQPQRQPQPQTVRPFADPTPVRFEQPRPHRPAFRPEPRPQLFRDEDAPPRAPARPTPAPHKARGPRDKKPVAQVIRKYREDNADGSITWGFENDDGSFKEETIGVDCVTRGRYGYVDPDGMKREYSYETGIPCDKSGAEDAGYVDWQDNKAVLPNGVTIDLAAMAKKSKRPHTHR